MPHLFDRVLPGLMPTYCRIEILTEDDGTITLTVYEGDGPGFISSRELDLYECLTLYEAADVMGALVDGWAGR